MTKDTKRLVDEIELDSSSRSSAKHVRCSITCLIDLPDEILLLICRYLPPAYVLYSFYTSETPEMPLHRIISDYYTKIRFDKIKNHEYLYLSNLIPLPVESLILSNEHVTCLIKRYFTCIPTNKIASMFDNLKRLTLNDCSVEDLASIKIYTINLSQLEYLHITIRKLNENIDTKFLRSYDSSINQFSFDERMRSLHTVSIELNDGLVLNKLLIPNQTLRNVNVILQTIDDLYVLLDGLVPNVQTMIIQLSQSRILTCLRPRITPPCPQLTDEGTNSTD